MFSLTKGGVLARHLWYKIKGMKGAKKDKVERMHHDLELGQGSRRLLPGKWGMINNGREELRNWNYWRERRARPETVREKKKKEVMAKGTILGDEENKLFPCGQPTEIEHGERHWRDKHFIQRLCLYSLSFSHVFRNCSLLQRANRENSL